MPIKFMPMSHQAKFYAVCGRRLQRLAGKMYWHGNKLATEQQQL
jgi:hypothetical protein